jgi:signal transduction histidine kinase
MTVRSVNFIAHARLKDIVGRGLINDDNVAIIELIKNGKDAGSKNVAIAFSRASEFVEESTIVIQDFGEGMSLDDIRYKWLNIAYSEKKNSTRKNGQPFAGSKGIGRFSCDRLGKFLKLYTKTNAGEFHCLEIDWTKFEVDERDRQIGTIKAKVREVDDSVFRLETGLASFKHGTVLVISDLRSIWSKKELAALRNKLERFAIDPKRSFKISLSSSDFPGDTSISGEVENRVFEDLDFRTTSITADISAQANDLVISLRHDGEEVFSLRERNAYGNLSRIRLRVFYLNTQAKAYFKRQTGYHSVDFGSVFMFLNGFRVLPYGDESNDWLALDRRKQQGTKRFLSTRDLVGYIEVEDSHEKFLPVSSREGLVNNPTFAELTSDERNIKSSFDEEILYGLFHKVFRKLERFVIEGLDWDRINESANSLQEVKVVDSQSLDYAANGDQILSSLIPAITVRTPRSHVLDLKVNLPFVAKIARDAVESYGTFVETLQEKFEGTSVAAITPSEKRNLSRFIERQAKELATKDKSVKELGQANTQLLETKLETERQLNIEQKRRLFAEFESTSDQKRILQLHHQIGLLSGKLFKAFDRTIRKYIEEPESFTVQRLVDLIERSIFDIDKIRKVSNFASKASFDISTNKVTADLAQFIEEYVESFKDLSLEWNIQIAFSNPDRISLRRTFRPIEASMLIDNLIDNAGKASARDLEISINRVSDKVRIQFADNGNGLPAHIKPEELFHSGVTTTSGSGIGLRHAQKITEELGGTISITNNKPKGAKVTIEFHRT